MAKIIRANFPIWDDAIPTQAQRVRLANGGNPTGEPLYLYSFCAWPDGVLSMSAHMRQYFQLSSIRVDMEFTESEFARFRADMRGVGYELHEIERTPSPAWERLT